MQTKCKRSFLIFLSKRATFAAKMKGGIASCGLDCENFTIRMTPANKLNDVKVSQKQQ